MRDASAHDTIPLGELSTASLSIAPRAGRETYRSRTYMSVLRLGADHRALFYPEAIGSVAHQVTLLFVAEVAEVEVGARMASRTIGSSAASVLRQKADAWVSRDT
jgi:hypothetical protein